METQTTALRAILAEIDADDVTMLIAGNVPDWLSEQLAVYAEDRSQLAPREQRCQIGMVAPQRCSRKTTVTRDTGKALIRLCAKHDATNGNVVGIPVEAEAVGGVR